MKLGRGSRGQIVHTQPRRIAARSVANRLAQETGTELGDIIGYQVRFNDRSSSENLIKVVTDGILIAETQTDRFLSAYDSIIIDEAHERNLNIDFLFGYLKNILPKRPELKIVIPRQLLMPRSSRSILMMPQLLKYQGVCIRSIFCMKIV